MYGKVTQTNQTTVNVTHVSVDVGGETHRLLLTDVRTFPVHYPQTAGDADAAEAGLPLQHGGRGASRRYHDDEEEEAEEEAEEEGEREEGDEGDKEAEGNALFTLLLDVMQQRGVTAQQGELDVASKLLTLEAKCQALKQELAQLKTENELLEQRSDDTRCSVCFMDKR